MILLLTLTGLLGIAAVAHSECVLPQCGKLGPFKDLQVACHRLAAMTKGTMSEGDALCHLSTVEQTEEGGECGLPQRYIARESQRKILSGEGPLREVAWFSFGFSPQVYAVGLRTDRGWHTIEFTNAYHPGAGGACDALLVQQFETLQLVPGESEEVLLSFEYYSHDIDMGVNRVSEFNYRGTLICGMDGNAPYCAVDIPRKYEKARKLLFPSEEKNNPCPSSDATCRPSSRSYTTQLSFDAAHGTITVRPGKGTMPSVVTPLLGTHQILELPRL